jgi:hypothetical protein
MTESTAVRKRARMGLAYDGLVALVFVSVVALAVLPSQVSGEASNDYSNLLPGDDELPAGFDHQPQYDVTLEEGGVLRIFRFYTRGEPEVPSDAHASILIGLAVSESTEAATREFHDTIASWSRMGYGLASFDEDLGDESVAGRDGIAGGEYPKRAVLILTRFGRIMATVQWTDDPDAVTLDSVVEVMRLIEGRAYAAQTVSP